jgi:ureidoglycolate lyase
MILVERLTRESFADFGDVIATGGAAHFTINDGTAERYDDLAKVDVASEGGRPRVSIFIAQPRPRPIAIRMLERHPLGSQAFMPLDGRDYVVVVAPAGTIVRSAEVRAFRADGSQGVNFRRGVWHHPLLVLAAGSRFLVIDRAGPDANLEEVQLDAVLSLDP